MKKLVVLGVVFGLVFFFLPGILPAAEIKIGAIYPLTGQLAQAGLDHKHAIELLLEIINDPKYKHLKMPLAGAGGLPNLQGAKVSVVLTDHQGKPELGLSEAERLITQEKVVALAGCYHSSVTETASMVAERMKIPFLAPESTSPRLTLRGFKWFFRTSPHDETFSEAMFQCAQEIAKKKGIEIKSIALLYEDTLFGKDSARIEKELATKAGWKVLADLQYRRSATSLASEVMRLKAANADIFFPTAYSTDAILLTKTCKELEYNPPMVMAQGAGYADTAFAQTFGKDADGICSRAEFSLDVAKHRPIVAEINDLYKKRSGRDFTGPAARGFVGFLALIEAINRAGSTAPEAIREALTKTNIPGDQLITPWRGIKFDENGQNILVDAIIIQYQDGGKPCTVFPFDLAIREMMYPIPKWSERK
jgi:branched-chain amino acid transport system substrate-binding protein